MVFISDYHLPCSFKISINVFAFLYVKAYSKEIWEELSYPILVYTTQVNSAFRALRLVYSGVISQYHSPPSNRRERFLNFRPLGTLKIKV